jgi:S-formylglutathione hydrolase FrmB
VQKLWWVLAAVVWVTSVAAVPHASGAVDRQHDHVIATPALAAPADVRVLLPTDYDPSTEYPVLYLLHGGVGSSTDWTAIGDAAAITEPYDVIVVMPDAGGGGWYSDWHNQGRGGTPMWESFHIGELIDWVDATYSTIDDRSGRALAGLSMGGFGAMSYAARHPDLFVAAASFSGALDPVHATPGGFDVVQDAAVLTDRALPTSVWGPRATERTRWMAHNPTDLAVNLRGLELFVRTGNGRVGNRIDPLEYGCWRMSTSFHNALLAQGIDHYFEDYGPGGHTWDRWSEGLALAMPFFVDVFEDPPAPPSSVTYTAAEPAYDVFGWAVAFDRTTLAFSTLRDADAAGFELEGSGPATVTTPAFYAPGSIHTVTVAGVVGAVTADEGGRLTIDVPLDAPLLPGEPVAMSVTID